MSKYRRAARVDSNQGEIVKELRKIPGVKVELGHDDILVGFQGKTFWFEIKTGPKASRQEGQDELNENWTGHYSIVWSTEMILEEMGLQRGRSGRNDTS